jgi:hypothetical protein
MSYIEPSAAYPAAPGFRRGAPDTSREAAESVADAARTRSVQALAHITGQGPLGATADEVAAALEWERYSSRPRLAELHKQGEIVDSGNRRKGASGRAQTVWLGKAFAPRVDEPQGRLFG